MEKEYIICSAIWFQNDNVYDHQPINVERGFVICGHRHHNCFATASALSEVFGCEGERFQRLHDIQGFLTNTNRFVDRVEGLEIALKNDQVMDVEGIRGGKLFSEDLY